MLEVQCLLDGITLKKRSLLQALTKSLKYHKKCCRREFVLSLSQSTQSRTPLIRQDQKFKRRPGSKTLNVTAALQSKSSSDGMTAQQHLWRQLKQRDLLKETRPNADNRLKFKMLYIPCRQLKESVRAFYLNLVNDVSFVARLDSFERDLENYKYMR